MREWDQTTASVGRDRSGTDVLQNRPIFPVRRHPPCREGRVCGSCVTGEVIILASRAKNQQTVGSGGVLRAMHTCGRSSTRQILLLSGPQKLNFWLLYRVCLLEHGVYRQ